MLQIDSTIESQLFPRTFDSIQYSWIRFAAILDIELLQAIVLMLFNDSPTLKFTDIKEASGIEDAELRRTLQSLALGKSNRVLTKEPKVICFLL